ncbi:MAG: proline racemase family protein, partial [Bacteroidota bacterium]
STMCGHAIIAIAKLAVEMGWVEKTMPVTTLKIDAPCGRIEAFAKCNEAGVQSVSFHCVPSFVVALDQEVAVPEIGTVKYDVAYGGAYYAYVDAEALGLALIPENYTQLIHAGRAIKQAVMQSDVKIEHPFEADLSFLYGTIFIGGPMSDGVDSRNVCVFADGEVDRCPTGSGVSGRLPLHYRRGEIKIGETMKIESITGSVFTGSVLKTTSYGPYDAVIPVVEGTAYITGQHEFLIDPADPFGAGFFLR